MDLWDTMKRNNIHIIGTAGKDIEKGTKKYI